MAEPCSALGPRQPALSSLQRLALRSAEWQKLAHTNLYRQHQHGLLQGAADLGVREAAIPQTSSGGREGIPKALFPFLVPPTLPR